MTLREQYKTLESERENFLSDAREYSKLTIPSLIPPDTTGRHQGLYKPFQSTGSYGVNTLANKLLNALYPPSEPFFKFEINTSQEELEQLDSAALEAIDSSVSAIEQDVLREITKRGDRASIAEALMHLIVSGNCVLSIGESVTDYYPLQRYVCVRDGEGTLLKVILLDTLSYQTFKENNPNRTEIHQRHRGERSYDPKDIEVYTCMERKDGKWYVYEEVHGVVITDTKQVHPIDKPPYLVLRFNHIHGESYGRAYVENLYGDLRSLENLSQAMVEGAAISARAVFLVNPNGFTSARRFEGARNGDVMPGVPSDVAVVQANKGADLAVTANQIQRLDSKLSTAFMITANTRDAERVTATEIRAVTEEVQSILGGTYAVLSEEFQRPYVSRLVSILQRTNKIPGWPEGMIDIAIVTGTAGIGRGVDKEKLLQFMQALQQVLGGETVQKFVNVRVAISKLAASLGIDPSGLIRSEEDIQAEMQSQQEMAMASKLGGPALSAMGQVASSQLQGNQNQNGNEEEQTPS